MPRGQRTRSQAGRLPGQTTFAAIPTTSMLHGRGGQLLPPMTSREAQRRHREARYQPRRPPEVERAFERAEQARIRRELQEEDKAARERRAREQRLQRAQQKRQAQEARQREAGRPPPQAVRPGQQRLTSFFPKTYEHIVRRYGLAPLPGGGGAPTREDRMETEQPQPRARQDLGAGARRREAGGKQEVVVID
jgi:hypothetical protein